MNLCTYSMSHIALNGVLSVWIESVIWIENAWMKLHDETAIAFSFIDLETEASLFLVSGLV